jgi:hypothetical protein
MTLRETVEAYRKITGGAFGVDAALAAFGMPRAETERLFSAFDEDYNISRFLHLVCGEGERYSINGFPQTHVALDAGIEEML